MVLLAIVSSEDVEFIVIKCGCVVLDLRCLEHNIIRVVPVIDILYGKGPGDVSIVLQILPLGVDHILLAAV